MYDALLEDDDATRTRVAPKRFEEVVEASSAVPSDPTADTVVAKQAGDGEELATGIDDAESWSDDPVRMYLTPNG